MALNSREKRASAVSLYPGAPPSPTPLASPDQQWRQEVGWGYAGILVGDFVPPVEEEGVLSVQLFDALLEQLFREDEEIIVIES